MKKFNEFINESENIDSLQQKIDKIKKLGIDTLTNFIELKSVEDLKLPEYKYGTKGPLIFIHNNRIIIKSIIINLFSYNSKLLELLEDVWVNAHLIIKGCNKIPKFYKVKNLDVSNCNIKEIPEFFVDNLYLYDCKNLIKLPENLDVIELDLENCISLKRLPKNLKVENHLNIKGCINLEKDSIDKLSIEGRIIQ